MPDIGDLDPVFFAFRNDEISLGRAHEILRAWLDGQMWDLPSDWATAPKPHLPTAFDGDAEYILKRPAVKGEA